MVHHTSTTLILLRGLFCQTWTPFNSPLCPLPTFLFLLLLLPCPVCFPPHQTSSADPASAPEKAADSEEGKASSEEKTGDERNRSESPSTKTEPSANQKESALKKTELSSSQNSPKSEWCMIGVLHFFS